MKRKSKNIIMSIILVLTIGAAVFTMTFANNSSTSTNNNAQPPSFSQQQTDNSTDSNNSSQDETQNNTPPAKPDENSTQGDNQNGAPPEMPDENSSQSSNQNTPPDMPNYDSSSSDSSGGLETGYYILFGALSVVASLIIIYLIMSGFNKKTFKQTFKSKDKILIYILTLLILSSALTFASTFTANKLSNSTSFSNQGGPNMSQSQSVSYSAKKEITSDETISSGKYSSTTADENAILVNGEASADISNVTVSKSGDSDGGDSTSFYGNNSAILAKDGAKLNLSNVTVTTDANGANGVFSYGGSATTDNSKSDGTTVTISDSKITTTGNNAGGIMTTGGGIMNAKNLTVNTSGTSSAAIRSDRGGGTVKVDGGTYTTTGQGSPSIYSTADISVSNADLVAKASEGVVIEGANSVTLDNCKLTDTNNKLNGQSTTYKNIFLYQSMSGDADNGNAEFTAKNSTITTNKGDTLYVTNTTATISLENNTIVNNDSTGNFLRIQKDSWGNSGSNGGNVTLNLTNQKASGKIVVDSISTLKMTMKSNSYFEGAINNKNTAKSISLKLDKTSKIKLTADSYVTSLDDADSSYSNIDFNGYKLYVNGKAIN